MFSQQSQIIHNLISRLCSDNKAVRVHKKILLYLLAIIRGLFALLCSRGVLILNNNMRWCDYYISLYN